ncbi:CBS domain-containing protein [Acidobacteriota bacterium]
MDIRAKDIMVTEYDTIKPTATVQEAIKLMQFGRLNPRGRRVFGVMVTDETSELVGMISMYDILSHVRPPYMKTMDQNAGLSWEGQFTAACDKAKKLKVGDIMATKLVTVDENDHIAEIINLMVKRHVRRLPVLRGKQILGIIYISDVFYEVYKKLLV